MDSRKFKKINKDNSPKLRHKKKKTIINYKMIILIAAAILLVFIVGSAVFTMIQNSNLPENGEIIYPTQFNFTPYGYKFNNELYGNCLATNSNNSEDYYYFTLEQMSALAYHSKNSFNYSEGIYINYTIDENNGIKIVDKICDKDKKTIMKPASYDQYEFSQNARFLARDSEYCTDDFGFTPEEYADSILQDKSKSE